MQQRGPWGLGDRRHVVTADDIISAKKYVDELNRTHAVAQFGVENNITPQPTPELTDMVHRSSRNPKVPCSEIGICRGRYAHCWTAVCDLHAYMQKKLIASFKELLISGDCLLAFLGWKPGLSYRYLFLRLVGFQVLRPRFGILVTCTKEGNAHLGGIPQRQGKIRLPSDMTSRLNEPLFREVLPSECYLTVNAANMLTSEHSRRLAGLMIDLSSKEHVAWRVAVLNHRPLNLNGFDISDSPIKSEFPLWPVTDSMSTEVEIDVDDLPDCLAVDPLSVIKHVGRERDEPESEHSDDDLMGEFQLKDDDHCDDISREIAKQVSAAQSKERRKAQKRTKQARQPRHFTIKHNCVWVGDEKKPSGRIGALLHWDPPSLSVRCLKHDDCCITGDVYSENLLGLWISQADDWDTAEEHKAQCPDGLRPRLSRRQPNASSSTTIPH